jgi:hypothetical protein
MRIRQGIVMLIIILSAAVMVNVKETDADIEVQREVVIAPKSGRVGANIGSVNESTHITMIKADVTIRPGPLPASIQDWLAVVVMAKFILKNESAETLSLTVGFPVSNSEYSSCQVERFHVKSNGAINSVFNRITGYPSHIEHIYISGPDPPGHLDLPDYYDTNKPLAVRKGERIRARNLLGQEEIGTGAFQNLMVWKESFDPGQSRAIEVEYGIAVPLQKNRVTKRKEKGNYKGIWPQEANNMPIDFLGSLPEGDMFYFFDYYLTSGASWKGTIGQQTIALEMDRSWSGHRLYRYGGPEITELQKQGEGMTYAFSLRDAEPTANLLFALRRP